MLPRYVTHPSTVLPLDQSWIYYVPNLLLQKEKKFPIPLSTAISARDRTARTAQRLGRMRYDGEL